MTLPQDGTEIKQGPCLCMCAYTIESANLWLPSRATKSSLYTMRRPLTLLLTLLVCVCVCICVLSLRPESRQPSADCQDDALIVFMDAMSMRAQSCIHDSAITRLPHWQA